VRERGRWAKIQNLTNEPIHCKKELAIFPSSAGMSLIKLSLDGKNKIIPAQEEFDQ
jgi:hypothetical protein